MVKRKSRVLFSIFVLVSMLVQGSPAMSEDLIEEGPYDKLRFMRYCSISDTLLASELHIADHISLLDKSICFEDYIIRIEEIATDGYVCYANISIELLGDDAIALPLTCADETTPYYIPLSSHTQPVIFFDLTLSLNQNGETSESDEWAVSEDMRAIEFVETYRTRSTPVRSSDFVEDMTITFHISATRYENGTFHTAEHEICMDYTLSSLPEIYDFFPTDDMVEIANALGIEPPSFQAILTPLQLYTPGLDVRKMEDGHYFPAHQYAPDGTPYAWILVTEDKKIIYHGDTYQRFPQESIMYLFDMSTGKAMRLWPVHCVDGQLVVY